MTEENQKTPENPLDARLEALLFVASGPIAIQQIAGTLDLNSNEIERGLKELDQRYQLSGGLRIQRHGGRVQLTTAPELASDVEKFLGLESTTRLSRAGLETLAIIAYSQPITRPGIDAIRGVNSDGVLKSLLSKGLVQEIGRAEGPGRPILFGVTSDFLQHFGFSRIDDLPMFEALEPEIANQGDNRLLKD